MGGNPRHQTQRLDLVVSPLLTLKALQCCSPHTETVETSAVCNLPVAIKSAFPAGKRGVASVFFVASARLVHCAIRDSKVASGKALRYFSNFLVMSRFTREQHIGQPRYLYTNMYNPELLAVG
jgi:hypothetical protein